MNNAMAKNVFDLSKIVTLIPIRSFFNFIGYEVTWIDDKNSVKISKGNTIYYFQETKTEKDNNIYPMIIINGTSYMMFH